MRSKLQLDAKDFASGLDSASGKLSGFRRLMASASATAAGFLGASVIQRGIEGVKNQIGGIISAGSDMNETVSKTQVVFGDSFDAINKWASGSAKAFGLSKQQALDTVSTYGAMAKAAGQSGSAAVTFGEDLVGAASDLGSFWNFDPSQVAQDIQSGLAGESEPLRKYNIYLNETAVNAKAAEMGLVGSNGVLTDENKILARKALIMEQLGPAAGDYARTQKGLANGTRTLTAYFKNFQAWLGGKIVPTVAKGVAWINKLAGRFQRLREEGLSPTQALLKTLRIELYQMFGRGVLDAITSVARAFVAVWGAVKLWGGSLIDAFRSGSKVSDLVEKFPKPLQGMAKGFLTIADAVGDAFAAFRSGNFLEQLPDILSQIGAGLLDIGSFTLDIVIDGALKLGGDLLKWAGDLYGWVKAQLFGAKATGDPMLSGLPVGSGLAPISFGDVLVSGALVIAGQIAEWAGNLWGWIKETLGVGRSATGDGTGGPDSDRTVTIGDVLIDGALALGSTLLAVAQDLGGWLWSQLGAVWDGTVEIASAAASIVSWSVSDAGIPSLVGAIAAKVKGFTLELYDFYVHVNPPPDPNITATDKDSWHEKIWKAVTGIFTAPAGSTDDAMKAGEKAGRSTTESFFSGINSGALAVINFGGDLPGMIGGLFGGGGGGAGGGSESRLSQIQGAIVGYLKGIFEGMWDAQAMQDLRDEITADASDFWNLLKDNLTNPDVTGWTPPTWPDWVTDPSDWISPVLKLVNLINDTASALESAWNKLTFWRDKTNAATAADTALKSGSGGGPHGRFAQPTGGSEFSNPPGGVPVEVPEGFVSGWHTALSNVGADIQEFAKRKTDFSDVKSEVDKTSTGSIAALRLMGDATRQTASIIQSGVHQIANAFSSLPGQLRYYAAAAVNGFVSELLRGVAEAQAAATAMAAAVAIAVAARLQIHSPSRVMANLGRHTVDPFLNELQRGATQADRFFAGMTMPGAGRSGATGAGGDVYYVIEGNIIGGDIERWIEGKIATGQVKQIDRRISSRGLGESY